MRRTLNETYRNSAEEFADKVVTALGDQVDAIVLFGSVARADARQDSDIDILVIAPNPSITRDRLSEICANLMYDSGYSFFLSFAQISRDEFLKLSEIGSPFIKNVLAEGIVLYDNRTYSRIRQQAATVS